LLKSTRLFQSNGDGTSMQIYRDDRDDIRTLFIRIGTISGSA